jgi:hypothetical protein
MDPFLLALIVSFLLVKGSVEDLVFAFKGKESPRIRARKERMANKSVAAKLAHAAADKLADRIVNGAKPKGPMRQYLADLWEDAWDTATDSRRRAKEDKAKRAAAGRADDADPLGGVPDPPDPVGSPDDAADDDAKGRARSDDDRSTADDERAGSGGRKERRWWRRPPYWWTWYKPAPPEPEPEPTEPIQATAERTDVPEPEKPKAITSGEETSEKSGSGSTTTESASKTADAGASTAPEDAPVDADSVDFVCDRDCKNADLELAEARERGVCAHCGGWGNYVGPHLGYGYHEHIRCPVCSGTGKFNDPSKKSPEAPPEASTTTAEVPALPSTSAVPAQSGGSSTMSTAMETTEGGSEGGQNGAIRYANKMLGQCEKWVVSLETTSSSLEGEQWSGDAVTGFRQAKDAISGVRAGIQAALDSLIDAMPVQDAYNAAPQAGSKESVTAD